MKYTALNAVVMTLTKLKSNDARRIKTHSPRPRLIGLRLGGRAIRTWTQAREPANRAAMGRWNPGYTKPGGRRLAPNFGREKPSKLTELGLVG